MYKEDERLMRKGLPEHIGNDLKKGILHTKNQIDIMLREVSDMLGALTK